MIKSSYITSGIVKKLYKPPKDSHKGQNGKLTIIGGSKLFHGASLWALKVSSRIVDMVYYVSVAENRKLTTYLKKRLYSFIAVPLGKEGEYIKESEVILIGPGMVRGSKHYTGTKESGESTRKKVLNLLRKFPDKKWILDAGALQIISPVVLKKLPQVIITPHVKEFSNLFGIKNHESRIMNKADRYIRETIKTVQEKAQQYDCTIVLKGIIDIIASPEGNIKLNKTGNEGMTKGGTGDVLAGLIAALACKNELFLAACAGTYLNGLAGDQLYKKVGPYFNADDLVDQIPIIMKKIV